MRCVTKALGLACLALAAFNTSAQTFPTKPVRIIVPFAPGGVLDGLMRPIATQLSEGWGQATIIENRPGANTSVGTGVCAKGPPDGYTICASGNGVASNPILYRNLDYNPEKQLTPVTNMVFLDGVIVAHASMPFNNLRDMVAYAKANPGKLNFGSFGEGSPGHLYIEWIKNRAGVDIQHIAYKGAAPVIAANLANEVQLMYMGTGIILPHIKAGKLKPIVLPSPNRSRFLSGVPTFVEEGYDFKPSSWFGLFVNAGAPRPVVERIHAEVRKILMNPKFQEQVLTPQFYEAVANSPDQFAEFLKSERVLAAELIRISGMKPVDL